MVWSFRFLKLLQIWVDRGQLALNRFFMKIWELLQNCKIGCFWRDLQFYHPILKNIKIWKFHFRLILLRIMVLRARYHLTIILFTIWPTLFSLNNNRTQVRLLKLRLSAIIIIIILKRQQLIKHSAYIMLLLLQNDQILLGIRTLMVWCQTKHFFLYLRFHFIISFYKVKDVCCWRNFCFDSILITILIFIFDFNGLRLFFLFCEWFRFGILSLLLLLYVWCVFYLNFPLATHFLLFFWRFLFWWFSLLWLRLGLPWLRLLDFLRGVISRFEVVW